jgi:NAD(P)-dependent dehydrogenase (short-subunit alcohol dehydrogenase family)
MALTLTYPAGGALVVGGTGNVGEGIVRQMALAGVPLYFTYRGEAGRDGESRSLHLERELRDGGFDVTRTKMDFSDAAAIRSVIQAVVKKTGRLHSVMCGAGATVPFRKMVDFTPEEVDRFFAYDALANFRLYREAVLEMRRSGGGSITVCTTMANTRVLDYDGISAASKGAVESISKQIAAEEGRHGIRCNAVAMGWTSAGTMDEVIATLPELTREPETEVEMVSHLLRNHAVRTRLGRNSSPEEAGNLFAFLASDQGAFITGQTIVFDGGITL